MPPENHAAEVGYAQQCDCIAQVAGLLLLGSDHDGTSADS